MDAVSSTLGAWKRRMGAKLDRKNILKHVDRLKALARKHGGVLPSYTWLNENGFFSSYDLLRKAGLLGQFKRAARRK